MGALSCLLPSSSHSHLPRVCHRHTALDTDADADELASAVNALPGSHNATTTGQPNGTPLKWHHLSSFLTFTTGLVVVKKAVACKCRQYLPRTPNATAYGLFNGAPPASCACIRHSPVLSDYLGIILDLAMLRKCINVSTSGGPNTTAIGLLNGTPLAARTIRQVPRSH